MLEITLNDKMCQQGGKKRGESLTTRPSPDPTRGCVVVVVLDAPFIRQATIAVSALYQILEEMKECRGS